MHCYGNNKFSHLRAVADLSTIGSDLPTLLGVSTGIFVLAGLICMVLHLFSKTKYPRTRNFADAHQGPPVFFASDTGNKIIKFIINPNQNAHKFM